MKKIILAHDCETDNRGLDVTECSNELWESGLVIEVSLPFALQLVRNALENAGFKDWQLEDMTLNELENQLAEQKG